MRWASRPIEGKVTQIVPTADPGSRTFTVKIDLPANPQMRTGLFGRARFPRGQRDAIADSEDGGAESRATAGGVRGGQRPVGEFALRHAGCQLRPMRWKFYLDCRVATGSCCNRLIAT